MTTLSIPDFSLVVLIGPSGAGKSTFAARHFRPTEVISSDVCRGLVADDENDQDATAPAFELVHFMACKRLEQRRLTVIDATNLRPEHRRAYVTMARRYHAPAIAVLLNPGESVCRERNTRRAGRNIDPRLAAEHLKTLKRGIGGLQHEGFRHVHRMESAAAIDQAEIRRQPLQCDRRNDTGSLDIIGDVHGCCAELQSLLETLGYQVVFSGAGGSRTCRVIPPAGRKVAFLGDLVDRGPRIMDVLRLAMSMVAQGTALWVMGNHDDKFRRWLGGRNVQVSHGLAQTIEQLGDEPDAFRDQIRGFLDGLPTHYWLDHGRLCIAHAALKETMIGRDSGAVRAFALYGDTTGETDEFGLPVRQDWAVGYRGSTRVVYGHSPVPEAEWLNGTICLDTGCVFGGKLTALRYPENELVSVNARETYFEPSRPLGNR